MSGPQFLRHCCAVGSPVPTPTAVVRTRLQQQIGNYRADLPHTCDLEMWMRFATHASVGILRAVQAYYRWHGGNMGRAYYEGVLGDLREHKEACVEALTTPGSGVPDVEMLLDAVNRLVGEQAFWIASEAFDEGDIRRSRICLQFALEHCPRLRRSGMWWRFRAKRLIGHAMWRRILPAVRRMRGMPPALLPPAGACHFRIGDLTGWWPGSVA
jgi:hypothetical protein